MRRLLAMGLGCLLSVTASSEDLLTIFDQAVVNDPLLREAEYTRKATREARPQAWAAYLPQIGGQWTKSKAEESTNSLFPRLVESDPNDPNSPLVIQQQAQVGTSEPESERWGLQLTQSIFNWGQLVGLKQASRVAAQADANGVGHGTLRKIRLAGVLSGLCEDRVARRDAKAAVDRRP